MNARKFILEAVTLIAAAVLCALVSNALAARERKLALVGFYPNAQKVPAQATEVTGSLGSSVTGTATATVAPPPIAPNPATQQPRNPATPVTQKPSNPVTSTQAPPPAKPKPTFPPHPDKPYIEIKYDDVKALHDSGAP